MTPSSSIDWPAFLQQHDMHFHSLPQGWQEAPHFGNAMIGSMLYGLDGGLRLELFRADVCDHRDESYGWTAYSRPHFRIGHFALDTVGALTGCRLRKELWNAELTGTLTTDRGEIEIRHFTHAEEMAVVTELTPSEGERGLSWSWHPVAATTTRGGYPTTPEELERFAGRYGEHYRRTLCPPQPNPDGRLERAGEVSVWVQELWAGGQYATAWGECAVEGTRTHIATIANSYPEADAAARAVGDVARFLERRGRNRAVSGGASTASATTCAAEDSGRDRQTVGAQGLPLAWEAWLDTHRAWWHDYYPRSYLTIPDKTLESLYWQTIYRFGCSSRAGRYYVDTSGLWFQGGQWPYTTNDWNTQAAHWGVYAANRLEQGEEIVNRLYAGRENLIKAVLPEEWQQDSAYLHLATAGDMAGTRRSDMRYYDCVGCLPWLLHNAWWQYRFSMDDAMLREKIFPLLRRSINLYLHVVHEGEDGRLHLAPTYSPETDVYKDANFDLALFRWGCHTLLKACARLQIDDPLIPRWREVTDRLIDFPADEKGFMLGSEQTAWDDHRHLSHLLMIYPLYLVNIEQAGTAEVLSRSYDLAHGGAGSDDGAIEELVAMVQTHAGPMGTAMGEGDRALAGLKRLQAELTPNGLWPCGNNPCIESSLSLANNIQEMLIQSWSDPAAARSGPIRIFPALPSAWPDVEFHDLRAEGAFLVSAKRSGGVTRWVRIRSLAGEPCRVRVAMRDLIVEGAREHAWTDVSGGVVEIDLARGEEVVLTSRQDLLKSCAASPS